MKLTIEFVHSEMVMWLEHRGFQVVEEEHLFKQIYNPLASPAEARVTVVRETYGERRMLYGPPPSDEELHWNGPGTHSRYLEEAFRQEFKKWLLSQMYQEDPS
jgi:hypothetical protein